MNTVEARREAKRRWGKLWAIQKMKVDKSCAAAVGTDGKLRLVGRLGELSGDFIAMGWGSSWQAAFDDADEKC